MRVFAGIAVAMTLSGCAMHHRGPSNDWSAVRGIRAETYVFVVLDGDHFGYGPLERATDTMLAIRGLPAIPRATVVRVEMLGPITKDGPLTGFPIGAATVGGLAGTLTGIALDNGKVKGWSAAVLGAGIVAGFVYLARHTPPKPDHGTRIVYVRR